MADLSVNVSMTGRGAGLFADTNGNVIKEVLCDPFGGIIEDSNPDLSIPIGFAGGLHDRDLGFVRFGWRNLRYADQSMDRAGPDGVEWGGKGRTIIDGPKHGNWGGKNHSGGADGKQPPVNSADREYKRHDLNYGKAKRTPILGDVKKMQKEMIRAADKKLAGALKQLPDNSDHWDMPSSKGDKNASEWFRKKAIWWFGE